MNIRFDHARRLVGLPEDFEIKTAEDYHYAIRFWRDCVVKARRVDNDDLAALLSQVKECFKRRHHRLVNRRCPDCGAAKSLHADRCTLCARRDRFYKNRLHTHAVNSKEHEVGELVLIPPKRGGELAEAFAALKEVGDCFITDRGAQSVKNMANSLKVQVITRPVNPSEPNKKLRRLRVWRSDGKTPEQVNEIIRKRLAA